ncbi:MAG: hypothetical protein QOE60_2344 [Thermoleophilaceae bacterium]|nr:hypothetical protein [Thermoleophilaceae bacterium]
MSSTRCAAVAVLILVTAGCGGSGDKTTNPVSQGGSVEDQLGFTQKGIQAAQARVETDIAACMKAQGFDYTPVDPTAARAALTGGSNLSDEDFQKQYGYGIATLYGKGTQQTDPNERTKQSLTPADRLAYDQALSGGNPQQTFFVAADTGDFSLLGGCTKQATDRLLGGSELLTTLQRKLDELDDSIVQDQRMVRASEQWTQCMRQKTGETFEDSEAAEVDVLKRLAAVVGPLPEGEFAPGAFASSTPEGPYDPRALEDARRLEVEFSNADVACEEKHIVPVEDKVRAEKERAFRDANAELLRRVKPLGG